MKLRVGNQTVRLGPGALLGQGGEACVYRWRDQAIKVYHALPAKALARRIAKLREFPAGLPGAVLGPLEVVADLDGREVGFRMRRVDGAEDLRRLAQRHWREGRLGNDRVVQYFVGLHEALGALHTRQVVVGDLNDGNVLFDDGGVWLIDADSMQYGRHRCEVGHERTLDPLLYGVDLARAQAFTPESDWYAFAVLLFASLLHVHPYGGVHPDHPTLVRRAAAGHSLLRGDVALPKAARHWRILPDPLQEWFMSIFENRARAAFPRPLLDVVWARCHGCGAEHARRSCPECTVQVAVVAPAGRCKAVTVHRAEGRILAAAFEGALRYAAGDGARVYREDGRPALPGVPAAGRVVLGGERTFVSLPDHPLDATATHVVALEGEWLVERNSGLRLGSVLEGRTWFRVGPRLGYGFYRAGRITVHFLFRPDRPGLLQLELPHIEGRLLAAHAAFDERHVLIGLASELGGRTTHAQYLVGDDGRVRAGLAGDPGSSPVLASLRGKALWGGRLLQTTDGGLQRVRADGGTLVAGELFEQTEPFVSAGDGLLPAPDGSVYLIKPREIVKLSLL